MNKYDDQLMKFFFSNDNFKIVQTIIQQNIKEKFNINIVDNETAKKQLKNNFIKTYKENLESLKLIFNNTDKLKFLNQTVTETYINDFQKQTQQAKDTDQM